LRLFKDRQEAKGKRQEENSSLLPLKAGKRQKARGKFFPIAYCLLPIPYCLLPATDLMQ